VHFNFIEEVYPGLDSEKRRRISDQHPGLVKSLNEHLRQGSSFACSYHHKDAVSKRGGKEAQALYLKAVKCATVDQVCDA
jgi:hypothetical protein